MRLSRRRRLVGGRLRGLQVPRVLFAELADMAGANNEESRTAPDAVHAYCVARTHASTHAGTHARSLHPSPPATQPTNRTTSSRPPASPEHAQQGLSEGHQLVLGDGAAQRDGHDVALDGEVAAHHHIVHHL